MGPDSPAVAVFGASRTTPGEPEWEAAERCGRLIGEAGLSVMTGGYGGTMEAVSKGAAGVGAHVIGVTAPGVFSNRSGANRYVVEEIPAPTLTRRIDIMMDRAAATISLDGSIGTLTELMIAWNTAFVARFSDAAPQPVIAVGSKWHRIVADLTDTLATDGDLVTVADDVDQAVALIVAALG